MAGESYLDEIVSYLKRNLNKGYTLESLKWALIGQGYSKLEVEKAIRVVEKEGNLSKETKKPEKEKPEIKYEVIGPDNKPIETKIYTPKKSFWKRLFGL